MRLKPLMSGSQQPHASETLIWLASWVHQGSTYAQSLMTIGISVCGMVRVPSYLTTIIISTKRCMCHLIIVVLISFPYCSIAKMRINQTIITETLYRCHPIKSLPATPDMMQDTTVKTIQVNTPRVLSMNRRPAKAQLWTTPRSSWTTP